MGSICVDRDSFKQLTLLIGSHHLRGFVNRVAQFRCHQSCCPGTEGVADHRQLIPFRKNGK